MTSYFSGFYPSETADGAKGSAAFMDATNTDILQLYKRSAVALVDADKPNGSVTYTFATGIIDLSAVTNGWTTTIPAGSDPVYVVAATAASLETTDTIATNEWSSPIIFVQNGTSVATVFLYKRGNTSTLPATPTGNATYTFASGILLGTSSVGNTVSPFLNGWTQTAPDSAGNKYLFMVTATAISTGATDTIAFSEYSEVRIMAQDGAIGYTAYLTNESHTLTASSTGAVSSYVGASGEFKVFLDGVGDISNNFTLSTVSDPQLLTEAYSYPSGVPTYSITGGFDAGEEVATITMRATGSGAYLGVTLDKVFSLSKSKSGINGDPAKTLSISTSRQLIAYDSAGALSPAVQTTTLTATKQNTTSVVNWTIQDVLGNTLTPATYLSATSGDSINITAANFQAAISLNAAEGIVITGTLVDGVTLSDRITVMKVKSGTNGTNGTSPLIYDIVTSAPIIVKDAADAATTGTHSSTTIQGKRYDGNTTTNFGWVTVTANGDVEAATATDTSVTPFTLSPATTAAKSAYTIKLYNQATVSGATLLDTQTLSVVFKGATGAGGVNARAVSISTVTQAFAYDSAGATPSPANTVLTATALNTTGTVFYEFIVDGTSAQNTTTNTYTYTPQASFSNMPDTVRVNIREGGAATTILASDSIAITGLRNSTNGSDGLNALTTVLSNAAHTLPTTNAGVVTYTGSGTTLRLYEGTTELLYDGTGTANSSWKVVATGTNITPGGLTDSGNFVTVAAHSAMTANNASVSYNITGKRASGTAIDITIVQTLSKSIQGDNGANGANAVTAIVSNEAHVFPASNSGTVSSYVGSGTLIRVYEGATELVYDGTGTANGAWTVSAAVTNITAGSFTDSGNFVTVGQHSGVADGTDTSSIVYTITGKTSLGQSINITKTQTFSKSKTGASVTGTAATSALLTRESQSLFAYANGGVVSFASANGFLKIYSGNTDVTATATSFSATASGCTGTINTADNSPVAGQVKGYYQITAMSADTATLTLSATYSGTTFTKVYTITKTRGGYEILSVLPVADLFEGRVVFLTTDDKLYRYTGSAWVTSVPSTDISGTLTNAQIDSLAASKVTGTLTDAQLAGIAAAKVAGELTNAQIGITKVLGTIGGGNRLSNSNFKNVTGTLDLDGSMPASWNVYNNGGISVTTRIVPGGLFGTNYYRVTSNANTSSTLGVFSQQGSSIWTPGIPYVMSFWARAGGGTVGTNNATVFLYIRSAVLPTMPSGTFTYTFSTGVLSGGTLNGWSQTIPAGVDTLYSIAASAISNTTTDTIAATEFSGAVGRNMSCLFSNMGFTTSTQVLNPTLVQNEWRRYVFLVDPANNASTPSGEIFISYLSNGIPLISGSIIEICGPQIEQGQMVTAYAPRPDEILPGTITTTEISDGSITTAKIVTGAITANQIAANTITAANIAADTITATQIAANAITASEIAAGAITAGKITAGSIVSGDIAADTITAANIAANAITAAEINAGAVTTAKLAAGAVTANEIAANTITAAKIAANTITASEIATNAITADEVSAGAITSAKISVTNLQAISANIGTLRTATTGARVEISDNVIKVFDATGAGTLRIKIGNLAL